MRGGPGGGPPLSISAESAFALSPGWFRASLLSAKSAAHFPRVWFGASLRSHGAQRSSGRMRGPIERATPSVGADGNHSRHGESGSGGETRRFLSPLDTGALRAGSSPDVRVAEADWGGGRSAFESRAGSCGRVVTLSSLTTWLPAPCRGDSPHAMAVGARACVPERWTFRPQRVVAGGDRSARRAASRRGRRGPPCRLRRRRPGP